MARLTEQEYIQIAIAVKIRRSRAGDPDTTWQLDAASKSARSVQPDLRGRHYEVQQPVAIEIAPDRLEILCDGKPLVDQREFRLLNIQDEAGAVGVLLVVGLNGDGR